MTSGRWASSDRSHELPSNWRILVQLVHSRSGGRCEFQYPNGGRCPNDADGGVDHWEDPDDHRIQSLRDLCQGHHQRKTQREALDARYRRKAGRFRTPEPHPRGEK